MPILIWTTHKLADGWVLIRVEANLSEPQDRYPAVFRYCMAVHPFHFDELDEPVIAFFDVIAEMKYAIETGLQGRESLPASRAGAFAGP